MSTTSAENEILLQLDIKKSTLWLVDASGVRTGNMHVIPELVPVACLVPDARAPLSSLARQSIGVRRCVLRVLLNLNDSRSSELKSVFSCHQDKWPVNFI